MSSVERNLDGTFAALVATIVVGTMFGTSEYRRRLVRTTFAATPRRGQVLAAKAVVLAVATFAVGFVGSLAAIWLGVSLRDDGGEILLPTSTLTELRVAAGTAAMLALAAVLALAVGTMVRRSAAGVALAISLVVLPFLLSVAAVLPLTPAEWLLRVTPAAGFAVQQTLPEYDFVLANYTSPAGYYPLPPWAGFAVMCAWTAGALALAIVIVRRRDV
jgi:ABC-type transport system involved in multi-copper enzyme maturation permease subunit